jgi:hypothetical protein
MLSILFATVLTFFKNLSDSFSKTRPALQPGLRKTLMKSALDEERVTSMILDEEFVTSLILQRPAIVNRENSLKK